MNIGLLHKKVCSVVIGTGLVSTTYPTGIGSGVMYNVAIYWSGQSTREMLDRGCIVSYKANPDVNKSNKNRLISFDLYGSNREIMPQNTILVIMEIFWVTIVKRLF